MKKVIEGRLYNTDTARKICFVEHGMRGDFSRCEETLYKTPKGAWFVVGSGGPTSIYAVSNSPGSYSGASNVFSVLSDDQALEMASKHCDADLVVKLFPDRVEEG